MAASESIYIFRPSFTDVVPLSLITPRSESGLYDAPLFEFWCNWDLRDQVEMPLHDAGPVVISNRIAEALRGFSPALEFAPVVLHRHPKWLGKRRISPPWNRKKVPAKVPRDVESDTGWWAFTDVPDVDCIDWSNATEDDLLGPAATMAHAAAVGVLRPKGGFPPLFAIEHALDATYFVSGEAHARLTALGVRGVDFGEPIPVHGVLTAPRDSRG